jgi:hypothetical protein
MTRNFKDAGTIVRMPDYTCSADQEKGRSKRLRILRNLLAEKMRQIHPYRDRILR